MTAAFDELLKGPVVEAIAQRTDDELRDALKWVAVNRRRATSIGEWVMIQRVAARIKVELRKNRRP